VHAPASDQDGRTCPHPPRESVEKHSAGWLGSGVKPLSTADWLGSGVKPLSTADWLGSGVKPLSTADWLGSGVKPLSTADWLGSSVKPLSTADWLGSSVKPLSTADWLGSSLKWFHIDGWLAKTLALRHLPNGVGLWGRLNVLAAASQALVDEGGYSPGAVDALSGVLQDAGLAVPDDLDLTAISSLSSSLEDGEQVWETLKVVAPKVAESVERRSAELATPFRSRRAVRNSLAALVWTTVIGLYVAGVLLPAPYNLLVTLTLSTSGVSAPSAVKTMNRQLDKSRPPTKD